MRNAIASWLCAAALLAGANPAPAAGRAADDPDSGADLLGTPAPDWNFTRWTRGEPRTLQDLRGKVVLLRWFTEGCHFCEATLPGLEELRSRYADQGLVVLGVFHPKPPREVSDRFVRVVTKRLGFSGPVALDRDWKALGRYWLDGHDERNWTSVSFLVDKDGAIRWVHGGGEYHRSDDPRHAACDEDWRELGRAIEKALEKPKASATGLAR